MRRFINWIKFERFCKWHTKWTAMGGTLIVLLAATAWAQTTTRTLSWNRNTEPDMAYYNVYVGDDLLTSVTQPAETVQRVSVPVPVPTGQEAFTVAVTAVDTSGNESEKAVVYADTLAPAQPGNVTLISIRQGD